MTPKFELGGDFCTMHLPPSFIILCLVVYSGGSYRVDKQTNPHKQTNRQTSLKTSNALRYTMTLGI